MEHPVRSVIKPSFARERSIRALTALQNRLRAPISPASTGPDPGPTASDPDYQRLWEALGYDPTGMDSLIERTGLTAASLSSMLLVMELEGRVSSAYGRFTRN